MNDTRLVGTWATQLDDDGKAVPGQVLFTESGGVISQQVNTKSIGLGTWRLTGANSFEYGFTILAVNDEGTHIGEARVQVEGTFDTDTTWTGTGGANFFNLQGERLRGHGGSKVTAQKRSAA